MTDVDATPHPATGTVTLGVGNGYISLTIAEAGKLATQLTDATLVLRTVPGLERLTDRERDVLDRFLSGARVRQIAAACDLAPATVRNHLSTIFHKVGVTNQAGLIALLRPEVIG